MTPNELKEKLLHLIKKCDGQEARSVLLEYKNSRGSQLEAYKVLKQIRTIITDEGLEEKYEDLVLDIMDTVVGTVAPPDAMQAATHFRIKR